VPDALGTLMGDPDRAKASRVMHAMMQMKKIDVAKLEEAYNS
jgi:predicted 3-demethylubiquinone-9 3-methyltransferase (glyoxalase superfamily)